jgi:hypothetical protein
MKASVSNPCVRPGGPVTLTVDTEPEAFIGYDTQYSDNRNGMNGGYGGTGSGKADSKGVFTATWTVGPTAPPGPVKTTMNGVGSGYSGNKVVLTYQVADTSGRCP